MTVVSSFAAAELDPVRLKARGAIMLRDFLLYADQGGVQSPSQAKTPQLDPLVANLAVRLRAEGLVVHAGYGTSAQRLDLAVEDPHRPGRVLVAVEADGLGYAAMSSTRDRDRLRVEQLRRLGWEHVRIWSTDLFRNPARDVARVIAAVHSASASRPAGGQSSQSQPAANQSAGKPGKGPEAARARDTTGSSPEQSHDDTDAGWGERPNEEAQDQWLREQQPPHWG
jgi:hypothetical protein